MSNLRLMYCLFCLLPGWLHAGEPAVATRILSQGYAVDPTTVLEIQNQHGAIHVYSRDTVGISLRVTITARASTDERAQARLEAVEVRERTFGTNIQWETEIRDGGTTPFTDDLEVVYALYLPPTHPLKLVQRHGDIHLQGRTANVDLDLRHGALAAGQLDGQGNRLRLAFAEAEILTLAGGDLDLSVSDLHIREAGDLYLRSKTAKVRIDSVGRLDLICHLGELTLGEVGHLQGEYSATEVSIARLHAGAILTASYAPALAITEVAATVQELDLQGTATGFRVGLGADTPIDLDAALSHGELRTEGTDWEIEPEPGDARHERFYRLAPDALSRTATAPVRIRIRNRYGHVKLTQPAPEGREIEVLEDPE